jgi:hypothetical protein
MGGDARLRRRGFFAGGCHPRLVALKRTIDETVASRAGAARAGLSAPGRCSVRIRAKVFRRSVSKLAVYRNEGSRIDFM